MNTYHSTRPNSYARIKVVIDKIYPHQNNQSTVQVNRGIKHSRLGSHTDILLS